MLYSIIRLLVFLILKIIFGIKVFGKNYIPKKGGFILASNHVSYLDPVVLAVACPRRLNFMARDDLFCNPLFAWFLSRVGAFPVKRNSADPSAIKEAMRRLKHAEPLLLFPEGSRSFEGMPLEPQPGIGFLGAKLNVPVIPVFIRGTDKALPRGARLIRPHRISVYFGKQIFIERRMPYQDIARRIMQEIRHLVWQELN
jgi:1-acyl-sn-glycerol-3-phosphate acyltransferase